MKIENVTWVARDKQFDTMLWDTVSDRAQTNDLTDPDIEGRLKTQMVELMKEADTPIEQFERLQLDPN